MLDKNEALEERHNDKKTVGTTNSFFGENVAQMYNSTSWNRYPKLFKECTDRLPKNGIIMSFGCSIGYEGFSQFLYKGAEKATVVGVDINPENIADAKALQEKYYPDIGDRILFTTSLEVAMTGRRFDLIYANSVLCRWKMTKDMENISHIYPFDEFEKMLRILAESLKVGGFLVVYNGNYRLTDTSLSKYFEPLVHVVEKHFVHQYDPQGNRVADGEKNYPAIFKKIREL
ncbi:MAG: class I SAM-dependent methyltransferase [Sulfurimonas sp.]|nr:class I SAM-dependent methyltransferase [Sulfurimonas sp.]MDQ7059914.1 class I SAM-dependent methyltransferase [Sulfurimonas sp.]